MSKFNKENIIKNSRQLLATMKSMCEYTYTELQALTGFDSVALCYAILQLVNDGKIDQTRQAAGVCYAVSR